MKVIAIIRNKETIEAIQPFVYFLPASVTVNETGCEFDAHSEN